MQYWNQSRRKRNVRKRSRAAVERAETKAKIKQTLEWAGDLIHIGPPDSLPLHIQSWAMYNYLHPPVVEERKDVATERTVVRPKATSMYSMRKRPRSTRRLRA